jgi:hypothetical protein
MAFRARQGFDINRKQNIGLRWKKRKEKKYKKKDKKNIGIPAAILLS